MSPAIAQKFIPNEYSKLGKKKSYFLTLPSSTVHAVFVTITTYYLIITGGMSNMFVSESKLGFFQLQCSLGYFLADFIFCCFDKDLRQDKASLAHHITAMLGAFFALYMQGVLMFVVVVRFISELSTPFLNLFWLLMMLDKKESRLFLITSVAMVITFFLCRVAPMYWLWKVLLTTLLDPRSAIAPLSLRVWSFFTYLIFDVLNIIWFWKMLKGSVKLFMKVTKKSK